MNLWLALGILALTLLAVAALIGWLFWLDDRSMRDR